MKFEYIVHICCRHFSCCERVSQWYEVSKSCKLVNHYHHTVHCARMRQPFHKVHGDCLSCCARYRERFQKTGVTDSIWFRLLTGWAGLHKFTSLLLHFRPGHKFLQTSICCWEPWMATQDACVKSMQNLALQFWGSTQLDSLVEV
jgi:hypothetical protein